MDNHLQAWTREVSELSNALQHAMMERDTARRENTALQAKLAQRDELLAEAIDTIDYCIRYAVGDDARLMKDERAELARYSTELEARQ